MDKLKQWVLLTVAGCLAVVAAGWFLLLSPKHAEADDLRARVASQEASNQNLRTHLTVLKGQAKDLPRQQAKLAAVAVKLPPNPALPALIRALDAVSADSGVELVSIAPGAPVPVPPASTTATGAGTLSSIPLALQVVGGYFEVQQFLRGVETTARALRVTAVTLTPGSNPLSPPGGTAPQDGRTLNATITGQAYLTSAAPLVTAPSGTSGTPPVTAPSSTRTDTSATAPASVGQPG